MEKLVVIYSGEPEGIEIFYIKARDRIEAELYVLNKKGWDIQPYLDSIMTLEELKRTCLDMKIESFKWNHDESYITVETLRDNRGRKSEWLKRTITEISI